MYFFIVISFYKQYHCIKSRRLRCHAENIAVNVCNVVIKEQCSARQKCRHAANILIFKAFPSDLIYQPYRDDYGNKLQKIPRKIIAGAKNRCHALSEQYISKLKRPDKNVTALLRKLTVITFCKALYYFIERTRIVNGERPYRKYQHKAIRCDKYDSSRHPLFVMTKHILFLQKDKDCK